MNFFEYPSWMGSTLLLVGEAALVLIAAFIAFLIIASFWRRCKNTEPTDDRCSIELPLD